MLHAMTKKYILVLASEPTEVGKVEPFLEDLNKNLRLGEPQFNKLLVAATEAVNNGIIHGNRRDPRKKVTLTCEVNHETLIVRVDDEGQGVDTGHLPNPLTEENLLRENGRGVFLMRSLMDDVEFGRATAGSFVIMKMTLGRN